ncbi:hypothetical protein CALCODRAFT_262762 [Calocera cornea HHB12733]|uniref:DUF6593 domain-containing protein n=1 Tax=Calocera cornea HHB12733 TaxID=1353952 RepID=A0A165GFZ5_9BASI|nr:hypothetical protein CALCODRAFT_262762 [Calocera cornea HHB12733]
MTTLYSLYGNPRHTMLVTGSGEVVYQVKSEHGVSSIMRALPRKLGLEDEEQQFVVTGKLNWNRPITFQVGDSQPVPASKFLRVPISDSKFKQFMKMAEEHDKREFTSPSGNVYQWTLQGGDAKLRLKGTRDPIATYSMEQGSLLGKDTRAALFITPEGLEMLDLLVLTWVQVAMLINTFKSKGMFASIETEWALGSAGVDPGKDY